MLKSTWNTSDIIESKQQLMSYFESGCKKPTQFKIGTEHEKFLYYRGTTKRVAYGGLKGIEALLKGYVKHFDWQPIYENKKISALKRDEAFITLEPAGQLELSGAPHIHLHNTFGEVNTHFQELYRLLKNLDISYLSLGIDPFTRRENRPWVKKKRYAIMREYMPEKGTSGLDMMTGSATIQSNLDFSSEADMACKLKLALSIQPIITALFASSPFLYGKPNGFQSYRAYVWQHTDPDRCGWMPWVFEGKMTFEKYVDYLLDVPMYFIQIPGRGGKVETISALGQSFRDFLKGKLPAKPGAIPTMRDWENHIKCVFPEVRVKQFLEMRGADAGPMEHITALSAFWVGLLYDAKNLEKLEDMIKNWTNEDREHLYLTIPKQGFSTLFKGKSVHIFAKKLFYMAMEGLKRRKFFNTVGQDESIYLKPLAIYAEKGTNLAEGMLNSYNTDWHQDVRHIFK